MAFDLTDNIEIALRDSNPQPQLVLKIDGIETCFGAADIKKIARYGQDNIKYGQAGLVYGGLVSESNQESVISLSGATTTRIKQSLTPDQGKSSTISSMQVELTDKDGVISKLIKPNEAVSPAFDLLGRKVSLFSMFQDTAFPEDAIRIFVGFIDEIKTSPASVVFNLVHIDSKTKSDIFEKGETELNGAIGTGDTTITVNDTSDFLVPIIQPDGSSSDSTIRHYLKIDEEVMEYDSSTATTFNVILRGALGTIATTHADGNAVDSFYVLEGNTMDLGLKLLLSGQNGPYINDLSVTSFINVGGSDSVSNSIFFNNQDLIRDNNVRVGDYITTISSGLAENNVSDKRITEVTKNDLGTYLVIDAVSFSQELESPATIDIRNQYDTLGDGVNLDPDFVDIEQWEFIRDNFIQTFEQRFYIDDSIEDAKEFIETQCLLPAASFSVPRKSRNSVSYHVGPLPGEDLKMIDTSNVLNAGKLTPRRTTAKNFKNAVRHTFDRDVLDPELFANGILRVSATSLDRIPVGKKVLDIKAQGMRTDLSALNNSLQSTQRLLNRYEFGADFIQNINVNFTTGFNLEIGDIVQVDYADLQIADSRSGTRSGEPRLMEIINRSMDLRSFQVSIDVVDTNFSVSSRYARISPASQVKSATSGTTFIVKPSYQQVFGNNEYLKWRDFVGASLLIHSFDHTVSGTAILAQVENNNRITLETDLGFTPLEDYIVEFDIYDNQPDNVKLLYGFQSNLENDFADGGSFYQQF